MKTKTTLTFVSRGPRDYLTLITHHFAEKHGSEVPGWVAETFLSLKLSGEVRAMQMMTFGNRRLVIAYVA